MASSVTYIQCKATNQ